jgi:hypothetical protein
VIGARVEVPASRSSRLGLSIERTYGVSAGLLWYRLVQQAVATDPHPYRDLTAAGIHHNMQGSLH